eukprot:CAMPEP_0183739984 /NCGR_PEP_ID=MMETSP0737-20130205/58575_1 /TAXON_ID=385413 /ORGANISM="Thalassiosira miniscula, Strain CCMP1093" /LENGTH=163 /DNA_ID=CAMNT_0025974941 /DNA_START=402 /DNA_END=893 /DNA_ORIENTATION=+
MAHNQQSNVTNDQVQGYPPCSGSVDFNRARAVSFAPYSDLHIIPQDKTSSKAYSQEEIQRFVRRMMVDVHRLRQDLASAQNEVTGNQNIYCWVGLERYSSQSMMTRVATSRQDHIDAIFEELDAQEELDDCVEESLATVSRASSQWARGMAEQLAAVNLGMEE